MAETARDALVVTMPVSEESLLELPSGAKAVASEEDEGNEDEMTVCERA